MVRTYFFIFGSMISLVAVNNAQAENALWVDGQNLRSSFMRVYSRTLPPIGHIRFCRKHPRECRTARVQNKRFVLTKKRWRELIAINDLVNEMVLPVSDQDLYGEIERWTYPKGKGDCEDYVLLKQRLLVERGWPVNALLITVVSDEAGEGHAVLTARTAQGDYILDNKRPQVQAWNKVPYRFYKRQSYRNPKMWISLLPNLNDEVVAAAGAE